MISAELKDLPREDKRVIARRLLAIKEDYTVTAMWMCAACGGPAETAVLPEAFERPEETQVSMCNRCIASVLRDAAWFNPADWI